MSKQIKVTAASHYRIAQYGWCGGATMTVVEFVYCGVRHVARRFWRADTGCAGIELYTVCSVYGEGPFPGTYARTGADASRMERAVAREIDRARGALNVSPDVGARQLEMA